MLPTTTQVKDTVANMSGGQRLDHFRQLASEFKQEHKCTWAQACLAIKRKYPEAREAFGAPPKA
jgi:hypothetical protein